MGARRDQGNRWGESGQALVEYALILLLLMTLTLGGIEACRAIYTRNTLSYAAYESARYGMTHPTDVDGIRTRAIEVSVAVRLTPADITVDCGQCTSGSQLKVAIHYQFDSTFSLLIPTMTFTTSAMYYIK